MLLVVPIIYYIMVTLQVYVINGIFSLYDLLKSYFLKFILPTVNLSLHIQSCIYTYRLFYLNTVGFIDQKQLTKIA